MHPLEASEVADQALPTPAPRRPWWLLPALIMWIVLVLAGIVALRSLDDRPDRMPADIPATPSPSSSAWSDECTAEDLDDGMCLTYDDIRNQPTYTQSP